MHKTIAKAVTWRLIGTAEGPLCDRFLDHWTCRDGQ